MKRALVILDRGLQESLRPGSDYEFVANVHDEWQIEATPTHGERIGKAAAEAIRKRASTTGSAAPSQARISIGQSWAETH
jgi:DNA polymerase-1